MDEQSWEQKASCFWNRPYVRSLSEDLKETRSWIKDLRKKIPETMGKLGETVQGKMKNVMVDVSYFPK